MQMLKELKSILRNETQNKDGDKTRSSVREIKAAVDKRNIGDQSVRISLEQLETIALSSVRLAAMGPHLAALAGKLEKQVDEQAKHMDQIALGTKELTINLNKVVAQLEGASANVCSVVGEIARIAKQTHILSINASIEASRAGEQGRAFNVVAQEVQQLADQTRDSTAAIDKKVQAIQGSVRDLAASVVEKPGNRPSAITVHTVNVEVNAMAAASSGQREDARSLNGLGEQANHLAEELLITVGGFRLAVHRQAAKELTDVLARVSENFGNRRPLETDLLAWLQNHPGFELLYVTNNDGRQIIDNIGWKTDRTVADAKGFNRDWSDRLWYRNARINAAEVAISDIYRSAASGDFCFTVSSTVADAKGKSLGVLGADVNFQRLLTGDLQR